MKKLPNLYKNNNLKTKDNNKSFCLVDKKEIKQDINEQLNKIFNSKVYSYNIPVIIKTKDKEIKTSIVTRRKDYIKTLEEEKIMIKDINELRII